MDVDGAIAEGFAVRAFPSLHVAALTGCGWSAPDAVLLTRGAWSAENAPVQELRLLLTMARISRERAFLSLRSCRQLGR